MIQRDYIERLIEQCAAAIAQMRAFLRAGEVEAALRLASETADRLLGPLRPVLERMEPGSAVDFVGRFELGRIRIYAALAGEEGLIHQVRGDAALASARSSRALELYAAASLAGALLFEADLERIAALTTAADVERLDVRYRDEVRRLVAKAP